MEGMKQNLSLLLIAFLTLIIGVALINPIADTIYAGTETFVSSNETLNISDARVGANSIDEAVGFNVTARTNGRDVTTVSSIKMENGTSFVVTTDYISNVTNDGYIYFKNATTTINYTNNLTFVTYNYEGEDYIDHLTSRTFVKLITIFFAIAVIVGIFFYVKANWDKF